MRHLEVPDSDIIKSIAYQATATLKTGTVGAMEIVFKTSPDTVYRYEDVPDEHFIMLVSAESIGKEFSARFKKTKYPFTKSQYQPTLKKSVP